MLFKNETTTSAAWQQVYCSQLPLETTLGQELPCLRPRPFREWLASDSWSKRYKGLALFSQLRNSSEGSSSFRTPCSSLRLQGEPGSSAWRPTVQSCFLPFPSTSVGPKSTPYRTSAPQFSPQNRLPRTPNLWYLCGIFFLFSLYQAADSVVSSARGEAGLDECSLALAPSLQRVIAEKREKLQKPHFYFHLSHLVAVWTEPQRCTF